MRERVLESLVRRSGVERKREREMGIYVVLGALIETASDS